MGQAKKRGSFDERKKSAIDKRAIETARVKSLFKNRPGKSLLLPMLLGLAYGNEKARGRE